MGMGFTARTLRACALQPMLDLCGLPSGHRVSDAYPLAATIHQLHQRADT